MKSTFHYQQELRSSEFGTLLYNILPKGVYVAPTLTVGGSSVTMTGGTFLFYDNAGNIEHAVRISFDSNESLNTTTGAPSAGQYVYISFSYNPSVAATPALGLSSSRPSSASNNTILLGRIRNSGSGLTVDTTDMEMKGPSYSYPNPAISSIEYDSVAGTLQVSFSGLFQSNSGLGYAGTLNETGVEAGKAYQVYIDQTGTPKLRETPTGSSINMGKNILAYKEAGNTVFVPVFFSNRAEITSDSLTLSPTVVNSDQNLLNNIFTDPSNLNGAGEVILSKVVQRLVAEVKQLRAEMGSQDGSTEGTVWNTLKGLGSDLGSLNTFTNLTVTGVANFQGTVNFTGANINFSDSSLGSQSNPIKNLYISNVLYANNLRFLTL